MAQTDMYFYILWASPDLEGRRHRTNGEPIAPRRGQWYCGVSHSPQQRLFQHNCGRVRATRGRVWRSALVVGGLTERQAYQLERYMKNGDTRRKRDDILSHFYGVRRPCIADAAFMRRFGVTEDVADGSSVVPADPEYCPPMSYAEFERIELEEMKHDF